MQKYIKLRLYIVVILMAFISACKADTEMQNKIIDLDTKVADAQKKITALETENKKLNFELTQIKGHLTRVGNATVALQQSIEANRTASKTTTANRQSKSLPRKKKAVQP